jgi:OmpA-OmpF porin, OOP family
MTSKQLTLALVCLLAGCANHAARDRLQVQDPSVSQTGFHAQQSEQAGAPNRAWFNRYRDVRIDTGLTQLSQRLDALGLKGSGYAGGKAGCWIDAAREEYQAGNQWGFVQEAMGEADRLLVGLENGQPVAADGKLRTVAGVRSDLWNKLTSAKHAADDRKDCDEAKRLIACSEVQLSRAGHEAWRRDFDKSEARVQSVAATLESLDAKVAACPAKQAVVPAPQEAAPDSRQLSVDALFRFGAGDVTGLLPTAGAELDTLAASLAGDETISQVDVIGHTDRIGGASYNQHLSEQRATTVMHYLENHGASRLLMTTHGEGSSRPIVQCDQRDRAALIQCLSPNRRVEVRVYRVKR